MGYAPLSAGSAVSQILGNYHNNTGCARDWHEQVILAVTLFEFVPTSTIFW